MRRKRSFYAPDSSIFPADPSLGSLETLQEKWPCGPAWTGQLEALREAAALLQETCGNSGRIRQPYLQICQLLAQIRNRYIAHGTLVYQVSSPVTLALVTMVDCLARDFVEQRVFPRPEDLVPVGIRRIELSACLPDRRCGRLSFFLSAQRFFRFHQR